MIIIIIILILIIISLLDQSPDGPFKGQCKQIEKNIVNKQCFKNCNWQKEDQWVCTKSSQGVKSTENGEN